MEKAIRNPSDLVGEELSAVAFVRDYVEFHFDGVILRSLSNPSLTMNGVEYRFPEPGSRDALCSTIGSAVRSITLVEHESLKLTTSSEAQLTIPLHTAALRGSEAMHFVPGPNDPIQVW